MSAQVSDEPAVGSPPVRALLAGVGALVVGGGGLAWALAAAPPAATALVWPGVAAVVVIGGAVAAAVYYQQMLRLSRAREGGFERFWNRWRADAARFEDTLREVGERLRATAPIDDIGVPGDPVLRRFLDVFAAACRACVQDGAQCRTEVADLHDDLARLTGEWLPQAVTGVREERRPADQVRAGMARPARPLTEPVLDAVVDALADGERRAAATLNACQNAGARLQAANRKTLATIDGLLRTYERDAVFGDLMALDHEISMTGRIADSIVVLSGGRTGRRWTKPIGMESILRGALSRVRDYPRVRVQAGADGVAVSGHAAEGVMHALAELLDNATSFSPPPAAVAVYVEDVDAGAIITIEDSGLGMRRRELERAQHTVSSPTDLATLPGTRLGLPVVGRLAEKHGLEVHFRPSSRGGTGVVVMVPRHLLTEVPEPHAEPATALPAAPPAPAPPPEAPVRADGLPQRRRGATLTGEPEPSAETGTGAAPPASEGNPTARFAAFRRALGPAADTTEAADPDGRE
ncbi:MAG TPA: ATP-binding protein [Streptosporangiaceae bacterium]|jgi:signal transduction histidine kinase